ncbi:hypothetical protein NQZ68_010493 [Dissostichus eleginoides]|nr:hypothetical protein NQZ68_010493 [Dissostichus eleginoides]
METSWVEQESPSLEQNQASMGQTFQVPQELLLVLMGIFQVGHCQEPNLSNPQVSPEVTRPVKEMEREVLTEREEVQEEQEVFQVAQQEREEETVLLLELELDQEEQPVELEEHPNHQKEVLEELEQVLEELEAKVVLEQVLEELEQVLEEQAWSLGLVE